MNSGLTARTSVTITAPVDDVWEALVTPAAIKAYMFGTTVTSEWNVRMDELNKRDGLEFGPMARNI